MKFCPKCNHIMPDKSTQCEVCGEYVFEIEFTEEPELSSEQVRNILEEMGEHKNLITLDVE